MALASVMMQLFRQHCKLCYQAEKHCNVRVGCQECSVVGCVRTICWVEEQIDVKLATRLTLDAMKVC